MWFEVHGLTLGETRVDLVLGDVRLRDMYPGRQLQHDLQHRARHHISLGFPKYLP